jgi:GR25 family glycosyltransferase involved in LPS biosynthesis
MKCIYINLDKETERRSAIEENFSRYTTPGWALERFPAFDTRYVEQNQVQGRLRPAEKACFLSHRAVLEKNANASAPIIILEDDVMFGPSTCIPIERLAGISDSHDWDIVFAEVCVPQIGKMAELIKLQQQLSATQEVKLLDLSQFMFAGATAYIVNHKSIKKILAYIDAEKELNLPYDLLLRKLILEKKLTAFTFFPFLTSFSIEAGSAIREATMTELTLNLFRKMMWVDRDLTSIIPSIVSLDAHACDDELRMLGVIFAAMVSPSFAEI